MPFEYISFEPQRKFVLSFLYFNNAEDVCLYILSKTLISTVPWDDCGSFLRFSVTYEAQSIEEELSIMKELKERLNSLNLVF